MLWGRREEPPPPRPRPAMAVTVTLKTLQQQTFKIRMEPHETVRPRRSPPRGARAGPGWGWALRSPPPHPLTPRIPAGGSRPSRDSPESAMELGEGGGRGRRVPLIPLFVGGQARGVTCAPLASIWGGMKE